MVGRGIQNIEKYFFAFLDELGHQEFGIQSPPIRSLERKKMVPFGKRIVGFHYLLLQAKKVCHTEPGKSKQKDPTRALDALSGSLWHKIVGVATQQSSNSAVDNPSQICEDEGGQEEEKVCCVRDQIKVTTNGFLIELCVTEIRSLIIFIQYELNKGQRIDPFQLRQNYPWLARLGMSNFVISFKLEVWHWTSYL